MYQALSQANVSWRAVALCMLITVQPGMAHAQGAVDKSQWPSRITFATGPVGSFGYITGSPWASLVGAKINVPISVESTGGSSINVVMIEDNKADIGITASDLTYQAWQGADWTKGKQVRNQRTLMVYGANVIHIYAPRKSGITTLSQINGKSANPSRRRSGSDLVFRSIVAALGIEPSRISNSNPSDANGLLGDGRLDVAAVMGSPPHPAVSEFETNHDMVLIGMTDAERQKFLQKSPFLSPYDIPANTYKGQTAPVKSVASYIVIIVRADMPNSLAYALVKETYTNKGTLAGAHKSYAKLDPKDVLQATIPVHPGAVLFYKEQGIKVPAGGKAGS